MRTKNSFLNVLSNLSLEILSIIFAFVVRTLFIKFLGSQYLGLNGLLTNVLSMLSIAELGFGTAITFSLYKPLSKNDNEKVSILMSFYKKVYMYIGILILVLGIILSFFLKLIIKDYSLFSNINLIYFLYLINSVFWYFVSFKDILIVADQKNYKLTKINFLFKFIISFVQIAILYFTKNYILYLVSQFSLTLLQRFITNRYITKLYPNVSFKSNKSLDSDDSALIKKNIKAMIFHKIGDYSINGTDNIILSAALSINIVGIYSNYLLFINTLNTLISAIFKSVVSSIGNLIAENENKEKHIEVFNNINFIGFLIYGLSALILYFMLNRFITLWLGESYIFNNFIVLIIVLNFYFTGMRTPVSSFKIAAGIYNEDKYVPLIQALINLVVSIILVKPLGIAGVLIGTLVSSLVLPCWNRPYVVCKYVLKTSPKEYYISYIGYIFLLIINGLLLNQIFNTIKISSPVLFMVFIIITTIIIFILTILLIYRKSKPLKYLFSIINREMKKIWKRA